MLLTYDFGSGPKRIPLQSSMMGLLEQNRYTSTFEQSCIRNCLQFTTTTLSFTPVICAGPEIEPHKMSEEAMVLIVILAKAAVEVDGTERSTQQPDIFCRVHGVCEYAEEEGRMM